MRKFLKSAAIFYASMEELSARLEPRAEVRTLAFAHTGPLDGFAPAAFAAKR